MSKKFNLNDYKKSIQTNDVPLKSDTYVVLNDALQQVLGLPGLPLGHITQIFGLSDSGKTSLVFHTAAQAQKIGVLPVFIITENKVSWDRAKLMGVDVDNCIIEHAQYIEDVFVKIDRIVSDVSSGKLPMNVMIFVDSIGNTVSVDSVTQNKDGTVEQGGPMMKSAKVLREKMRVFSHKINDTRKTTSPFYAGLVFINHAYKQPPAFPGGPTTVVPYGGDGIFFSSSLVIRTKKNRALKAIVGGQEKGYGIISKISVEKNHITNVSNSGEFVITANDIIVNDKEAIEEYKKNNKDSWQNVKIED